MISKLILILLITMVTIEARPAEKDNEEEIVERADQADAVQKPNQKATQPKLTRAPPQFYEVDGEAFGDDFVDFGAQTGLHGAYMWFTSYPLHKVEKSEDDGEK